MSEAAQDSNYPDRIGIGDGPMVPCRVVAVDMVRNRDVPLISGTRGPDGVFRLDRDSAMLTAQLSRERMNAWIESMTPAFRALADRMQATFQALATAARPLAEFIAEHPELRDMQPEPATQGCHHWCGRWPDHECAGEATGALVYWPGGREVPMCDACQQVTRTQPSHPLTLASERNWPEQGSTCAHVCGPDPGHVCDAKAVTTLRHTLPSGGVRDLPLCGPCHTAETTG